VLLAANVRVGLEKLYFERGVKATKRAARQRA